MISAALMLFANTLLFSLRLDRSGSFPRPLSASEERMWLERLAQGDPEARNVLIERNLRLVAHIVKKYYGGQIENDDLMSIGTIGLIKAVSSYNFEKNTKFSTFAAKCIENEVLMVIRKNKNVENTVYLEESLDCDDKSSKLTLKDSLQDEFELAEYCEKQQQVDQLIKTVLQKLDARQRQVIVMRYGLFGNQQMTQQQVCEILGISRSYISRIEKKAVEILREDLIKKYN